MRRACFVALALSLIMSMGVLAQTTESVLGGKGTIRGTVVDDATGTGIPWAQIRIIRVAAQPSQSWIQVVTSLSGTYETIVDTGTYKLQAVPPYSSVRNWQPEWYDNVQNEASATPLRVTEGSVVIANFGLGTTVVPGAVTGTIKGTVIDDTTKLPIAGMLIMFVRTSSPSNGVATATTDPAGKYSAVLDTGTYLIRAEGLHALTGHGRYRSEWYDDVVDHSKATAVKLAPNATVTADFGLTPLFRPPSVTIEGMVTDTVGKPLVDATVVMMRTLQEMEAVTALIGAVPGVNAESITLDGLGVCQGALWSGRTDGTGHYKATVPPGPYIALASKPGYQPEYYKEKRNPAQATIIDAATNVKGINFTLTPLPVVTGNMLSGVVKDAKGTGVPSRVVLLPLANWTVHRLSRFTHTDVNGQYSILDVPSGKYLAMAIPFAGYAPAFYKKGAYGVMRWQAADTIVVTGNVSNIDIGVVPFTLRGLITLRGRIRSSAGIPLAGARVLVSSGQNELSGAALTNDAGEYSIDAVPSGPVSLVVDLEGYNGAEQTISPSPSNADGIDFVISPVSVTSNEGPSAVPTSYLLDQNYPNPFNPTTVVRYQLPEAGDVRLAVYDLLGREVSTLVNERKEVGIHQVTFDAAGLSSGLYVYRLTVGSYHDAKKMLVAK